MRLVQIAGRLAAAGPRWLSPLPCAGRIAWPAGGRLAVGSLLWLLYCAGVYGQGVPPGQVTLNWNASSDPTAAGYYIYYGGAPGFYTNKSNAGTNTTFVVAGLVAGATYYFTATTYNATAQESGFAPAISYNVPLPGVSNILTASTLTYGQRLSASTITGTVTNTGGVVIPGKFAFASPLAVIGAGTHTEPAIFTPTISTYFNSLPVNVQVTVAPAPLSIVALTQSKTYGQTLTSGSGSTMFYPSGLQNGETIGTVTLTVANNGGAPTATVAGAPYLITPSAATGGTFNASNYVTTYHSGKLGINRAPLTITALNQSKTFGQTLIFGSGSTLFATSGLQNGETIISVTLTVSNNGGASTATVAGSPYTITASAAGGGTMNAGNYIFTYLPGLLTVTPVVTVAPAALLMRIAPPVSVLPVMLNSPLLRSDGTIQLTFTGGRPGVNYELQDSSDLQRWNTLTNQMAGSNGLPVFLDPSATSNSLRFYRIITP